MPNPLGPHKSKLLGPHICGKFEFFYGFQFHS